MPGLVVKTAIAMTCLGLGGGVWVDSAFRRDMARAERALAGRSALAQTDLGAVEYAVSGAGADIVMLHGTGGGFDQGLLFSQGLRRAGFRIVAPSRFGYLRSVAPDRPDPLRQADALAQMLASLRIPRAVVAGGSAGVISAAAFALRYPDRCRGLVLLVPATNLGQGDPVRMSPAQKGIVTRLASSDFLFWAGVRFFPDRLTALLLATDPELVARAPAGERERVRRILWAMLPISRRTRGLLLDAAGAGSPVPFDYGAIRVPTLIVSVEDDRFGTASTARQLSRKIPGAKLRIFPKGGHVWVDHDDDIATVIASFVAALPAETDERDVAPGVS